MGQCPFVLSQVIAGHTQTEQFVGALLPMEGTLGLAPSGHTNQFEPFQLGDDLTPLTPHVRRWLRSIQGDQAI